MSKAVMISIKPKWVELIASGEKTVEVRKTRPKIDVPFKCYIYCTKPSYEHEDFFVIDAGTERARDFYGGSKVVGEFICEKTCIELVWYINGIVGYHSLLDGSCLNLEQLMNYGKGKPLYGWNISNLKMYDKPKELSEFRKPCIMPESPYCPCCEVGYESISEEEAEFYRFDGGGNTEWCCLNFIKRPPQSWGYVEELGE